KAAIDESKLNSSNIFQRGKFSAVDGERGVIAERHIRLNGFVTDWQIPGNQCRIDNIQPQLGDTEFVRFFDRHARKASQHCGLRQTEPKSAQLRRAVEWQSTFRWLRVVFYLRDQR